MDDFFGKQVRFTAVYKKRRTLDGRNSLVTRQERVAQNGEGICIGWRTLPETRLEISRDYYDGYSDYLRHTGHVTALLVVEGPRRNPVRVPVDSVEWVM